MKEALQHKEIVDALIVFCDYRERCSSEVEYKLKGYPIDDDLRERIINELKERSIFNDERYIEAFVGGKTRIKKWGRIKIRAALRMKKLPSEKIEMVFDQLIDEEQYLHHLNLLFEKKWDSLKNKTDYNTQQKLYRFLYSKGYESEYITSLLKTHLKT